MSAGRPYRVRLLSTDTYMVPTERRQAMHANQHYRQMRRNGFDRYRCRESVLVLILLWTAERLDWPQP